MTTEATQPPPAEAEQPATEQDATPTQPAEALEKAGQQQDPATPEATHAAAQTPHATKQPSSKEKPMTTEATQPTPAEAECKHPATQQGAAAQDSTPASRKRKTTQAANAKVKASAKRKKAEKGTQLESDAEDEPETFVVLKISKECFDVLYKDGDTTPRSWLFDWGSKRAADDKFVCFVSSSSNEILGTAHVRHRLIIKNFGCLRSSYAFTVANHRQKKAWRTRA